MSDHNFAGLFVEQARARGDAVALVAETGDFDPESGQRLLATLTFGDLHARSDALAFGLRDRAGLRRGERVLMLVKPSLDFFVLGVALWKLGAVPVLIDPGMGLRGFLDCVRQIRPTALMAIPAGHLLSRLKPSSFASVERRVAVGSGLFGGLRADALELPGGGPFPAAAVGPDDEAALLFTSGSTGPAKAARYTHGMFRAQSRLIGQMMGISPGEVDVPCFLPFAMFSVSLGMTVALPAIDFARPALADPRAVLRAVQRHRAHQLVGSPALMRRLEAFCRERDVRLPGLRRVLTFGAPIPPALHQAFGALLDPGVEVHTPYGATEGLPVADIASREILDDTARGTLAGQGTCVGRVVPGTELAIIAIDDGPIRRWSDARQLQPGEVGEICVKGPQVSPAYVERPEATALSKIPDGEGFWHRMGDLGRLDGAGRLWFCGRKDHRVTLADGRLLFPVQVEGVVNAHPEVARSAVVGVRGEAVLILELEPGPRDRQRVMREALALARSVEVGRDIARARVHPALPVDRRHNAKIHRPELAAWAARCG